MFANNVPKKAEGITNEVIMLLHLTRVDDVMSCKHLSFLFLAQKN